MRGSCWTVVGVLGLVAAVGCPQPIATRGGSPAAAPAAEAEAAKTAPPPAPEAPVPAAAPVAGDNVFALGAPTGTLAPLLGIDMGPDPVGAGKVELTKLYQERGVTLIRTHDFKGAFDLSAPDFIDTDSAASKIRAGGFGIYLRLGNSYGAGASTASTHDLVKSMTGMLDHVEKTGGAANPVQYVEVWNEPDNKEFWTQGEDAYIALYIEAARAIRAAHPKVKIGGPALTPAGSITERGRAFVAHFLSAVKADGAPLDFVSWHMYSNDPAAFAEAAKVYREAAEKAGFGDIEQHVSEWNTAYKAEGETPDGSARPGAAKGPEGGKRGDGQGRPAGGQGRRGDGQGRPGGGPGGGHRGGGGEGLDPVEGAARWADKHDTQVRIGARGSALTTADWIAMQMNGVDLSFFYRGPDPAPYPSAFYGMFYNDGRPKPAGYAALLWKRMFDHGTRLDLSGPTTGPIWALAGRSKAGETVVLLSNASANPASWTMTCPAGVVVPVGTLSIRAPAETVDVGTQPDCSGTLDAWEVRMLSWTGGV